MSEKLCQHHQSSKNSGVRYSVIAIGIVIVLILLTILIVWAVLRPHKPQFLLQDATLFVLSIPAANIISTTLQVTIASRNPNSRIGIYYDRMTVYAAYHDQQITYPTAIPPVYQCHKGVNVWSPFVYGNNVPVAPYTAAGLAGDRLAGAVPFVLSINGRVKWRVGSFTSGGYHLHVTCLAFIPAAGTAVGSGIAVKYQLSQSCSVSV